jgi:hypothetical protein
LVLIFHGRHLTKKNQKIHLSNRLQLLHVLIIIGTRSLDINQYFEVHVHVLYACVNVIFQITSIHLIKYINLSLSIKKYSFTIVIIKQNNLINIMSDI